VIPAQRFRVAQAGNYSGSLSVSTGESFKVSFTQLRGSSFGSGTRTFIVRRDGQRIGTIDVTESQGQSPDAGSANANVTLHEPGDYTIRDQQTGRTVSVSVSGQPTGTGFESDQEWNYTYTEPPEYEPVGPEIDPEDYRGIVNADNDAGVALAPALRREGMDLGPDGATVELPDGETVEVGQITESDEVTRYLEGDRAGDVVESDQDVVSDPTSSSGGGSGMIGVGVGVLALRVAGGAALLGGDD
jgi:hypothetical protein